MKQLIISVTAADIGFGRRRSMSCCPIALSLRRRGVTGPIEVDYDSIRFEDKAIPITRKIEKFMDAFDAGRKVTPTAFFVDASI